MTEKGDRAIQNEKDYSLPGILGGGEDFYDMEGNPVGMSFDDKYGLADIMGTGNGSYGYWRSTLHSFFSESMII